MTSREELVEKAEQAINAVHHTPGFADITTYPYAEAVAVLNAILPVVSTLAEVEALPDGTKVLDLSGEVWRKGGAFFYGTSAGRRCTLAWLSLRPLTVVWWP